MADDGIVRTSVLRHLESLLPAAENVARPAKAADGTGTVELHPDRVVPVLPVVEVDGRRGEPGSVEVAAGETVAVQLHAPADRKSVV